MHTSTQSEQQQALEDVRSTTVDELRSLLRGEMSAAETYHQALMLSRLMGQRGVLLACKTSHEQRVALLSDRIRQLGGEIPPSAGVWGAVAAMIEDAALLVSEKAAIAALELGEHQGLHDYSRALPKLDVNARALVETELRPRQVETHRVMSQLKSTMLD